MLIKTISKTWGEIKSNQVGIQVQSIFLIFLKVWLPGSWLFNKTKSAYSGVLCTWKHGSEFHECDLEILGKKNKEIEENHWTGERDLSLFLCLAPRRTPMPNPISIFSQDPEADVGTASRTGITDPTHALVLFYSVFSQDARTRNASFQSGRTVCFFLTEKPTQP